MRDIVKLSQLGNGAAKAKFEHYFENFRLTCRIQPLKTHATTLVCRDGSSASGARKAASYGGQ
jgi:hypothetical protein